MLPQSEAAMTLRNIARTQAGQPVSNTSKFPAGAHEVVVQGRANNGATRDLSSIIVFAKP
jgi:hypothetical protein